MEQAKNVALNLLQAVASQTKLPKTGKSGGDSDFQKLIEKAQSGQPDSEAAEQPKADKPDAAQKPEKNPGQEQEDPVELSKRMQVYLAPVAPEVLAQYPAEWLPQVQEGEPIVCIGVRTGANGEDIPILVGAKQAAQMYGKDIVDPALYDVSDPKADAMLEATDPTVEHGPAQMLEKLADEVAGVEENGPQLFQTGEAGADTEAEITDADVGPQTLFHDVKAAPVKVGDVYTEQPDQPDVAKQIDTGLAQALEKGESMVRIQLNPENLGSVTVEITRSAEGLIRVALSAHSGETRGLLERHAGELQGMIANRTQQDVEVNVQHSQEGQQGQNQQNPYDGRNGSGQGGQEERRQPRRGQSGDSRDFMQQLRLGLIPGDE